MKEVNLVFPHQLFEKSPLLSYKATFCLIEEYHFFRQFRFHKQKIAFHRATMKFYESYLQKAGRKVIYIESHTENSDILQYIKELQRKGTARINFIDPTDSRLEQRLRNAAASTDIQLNMLETPLFLNTKKENTVFFKPAKKKFLQTTFYKAERKKRHILVDTGMKPLGDKWSFDSDNRKRYPADKTPPVLRYPKQTAFHSEAIEYVGKHFPTNPGGLGRKPLYPGDFRSAIAWLQQFLKNRFYDFGPYEDAILADEAVLHHSVLSPLLNTGLLAPQYVLEEALKYSAQHGVPLNSTEGFVRQIVGWREFIRGIYECQGEAERCTNFWGFSRKIPASFYEAATGVLPIDTTIRKVLQSGYCHHIERLMVLGNFMVLCEFDPDEVYKWFMELFIDAYDWVMVPNVYGMSQFADGGLMATKPYISGSNYLMKMSDYAKGDWQKIWDGLFWRFMHIHRKFFLKNPRLGMLVRTFDAMAAAKQKKIIKDAEQYLAQL
jgi:deoxyribodipyrimidine photolyase-related protein